MLGDPIMSRVPSMSKIAAFWHSFAHHAAGVLDTFATESVALRIVFMPA